jgi:hypothetical protein
MGGPAGKRGQYGVINRCDPVYWFPPSTSASIRQALLALPSRSSEIKNAVKEGLSSVGYDRATGGDPS